jgi:hypothetical protein
VQSNRLDLEEIATSRCAHFVGVEKFSLRPMVLNGLGAVKINKMATGAAVTMLGPKLFSILRREAPEDAEFRAALFEEVERSFAWEGYEAGSSGCWVRSADLPIRQVVKIGNLKTQACSLIWGLSFDFAPLPDQNCRKLRWHRTVRSAEPMLIHDPLDYWTHGTDPELRIMRMTRPGQNRKTARRLVVMAADWLRNMHSLDAAIAGFEAWQARPFIRFGYANYWRAPIAHAFCLGKAGRKAEARSMLEHWISSNPQAAPTVISGLCAGLEDL